MKNIIDKFFELENSDEYTKLLIHHSIEIIFYDLIIILVTSIIGFITNSFLETCVFNISFMYIRRYTGGYHSQSHLGCITTYLIIFLISIVTIKNIHTINMILIIILNSFIGFIIFKYAPLENKNNLLSDKEKLFNKNKSRTSFIFYSSIIYVLYLFNVKIYITLLISLTIVAILMIIELTIRRIKLWN